MKIFWQWQAFQDFQQPAVLYQLLQLRSAVFVVEQQCAYPDMDDQDDRALHLMGWAMDQQLAACARLFFPTETQPDCSFGRIAVAPAFRGLGIADQMMTEILKHFASSPYHDRNIVISAQQYLEKFYGKFGFQSQGEAYLEDEIWHINMVLEKL